MVHFTFAFLLFTFAFLLGVSMQAPNQQQSPQLLPEVKHIIAVSSGKGGVGKTTVSVNLAISLAKTGASVGLLDADIYGPNVPLMMGLNQQPDVHDDEKIIPLEAHGVRFMSLGVITDANTPIIWRGPIVGKVIQQFMMDVHWGELDYLVVDLPPGTGDAQLTLSQTVPLSGAVIVTTPQNVALEDVHRGIEMFRKVNVPLLGIVENMSYFLCPCCGDKTPLFGDGGGTRVADAFSLPLLGQIPIQPEIRIGGDEGQPISLGDNEPARSFADIAKKLKEMLGESAQAAPTITIS
ncbi:MAG: Mrp/NBP35 family ATP-binding protein [Candidatus Latescibacteria bacterium]|nr:Mrp/NBP35 family ATP-binding protein [Candidatus Latescibacterota bacterium]